MPTPHQQFWQCLPVIYGSGSEHMQRDLDLLDKHQQGLIPSTFYLSVWTPAALSVGYHQQNLRADWHKLTPIRRPTGGRAVWHGGDITYTLVTSGLRGNLVETYQQLSSILIQAFAQLGVSLDYGGGDPDYRGQTACFAQPTGADLCWQGYKVIGSAQLRRGQAILQQGSILLEPDYRFLQELFPDTDLPIRGLQEILGYTPHPQAMRRVIAQSIAEVLQTEVSWVI